ncbi:unnamed protein product, partial [marine sediment metagenome]
DLSSFSDHDLYRATFKFHALDKDDNGKVYLYMNDEVYVDIGNKELYYHTFENTVSFYFNFTSQTWQVYINDETSPRKEFLDSSSTNICPRIESFYFDKSKGIRITSIKSQFTTGVR